MEVKAKIIVKSIEVNLGDRSSVVATFTLKVGNMPSPILNQAQRITVPSTDELEKYIRDVVTKQIGEIITKSEEE